MASCAAMEPVPPRGSSVGKVVASVVLVGLGLSGLAMSLCGGFFAGFSVFEYLGSDSPSGDAKQWAVGFVVLGSGAFLVGLLVMFLARMAWKRTRN